MNQRAIFKSNKITITQLLVMVSLIASATVIGIVVSVFAISPLAIIILLTVPIIFFTVFWFTQNPDKFIIFVAVFIPFEDFVIKWLPLSIQNYARYILEVLIVTIFLLVVLKYWHKRGLKWHRDILNFSLGIFLILSFLSAIANNVPIFIYFLSLKNLLRYMFLYYMLSFLNLPLSYIKRLTIIMISVAVVQAVLGITEEVVGLSVTNFLKSNTTGFTTLTGIANPLVFWAKAKPSGTIGLYSSYGVFLVFWSIFTLTKFLIAPSKNKRYVLLFFILSIGVFVSRARTSWVLLIIGIILSMFFLKRRWLVNGAMISISIILATLLVWGSINIFGPQGPQVTDWDTLIISMREDTPIFQAESVLQRLGEVLTIEYWRKASRVVTLTITLPEILRNYPFLGVGPGTMGSEVTGGGSTSPGIYPQYSHQNWLDVPENVVIWTADTGFVAMIAQFGLLGVLPWGIFLWLLFKMSWRNFTRSKIPFVSWFSAGMLVNIILFFLTEFGGHYITYRAYGVYFWIWAGCMVNIHRFQNTERLQTKTNKQDISRLSNLNQI